MPNQHPTWHCSIQSGFSDGDEGPMGGAVVVVNDGYTYVMTPQQPWWQQSMWDLSGCCGDTDEQNRFLSLMK